MTLRVVNDIRRMGRKMYLKIGCSVSDILQLILYWVYIAFSITAIIKVMHLIYNEDPYTLINNSALILI